MLKSEDLTKSQRTITLVAIPKEVAETIEDLRYSTHGDEYIIALAMLSGGGISTVTKTLKSIPFEKLMSALTNGWVIEKTAEEVAHGSILYQYRQHKAGALNYSTSSNYYGGYVEAVEDVINTLGITIEGING